MKVVLMLTLVIFAYAVSNAAADCQYQQNKKLYEFATKEISSTIESPYRYKLTDCRSSVRQTGQEYLVDFCMRETTCKRTEIGSDGNLENCRFKTGTKDVCCVAKVIHGDDEFNMKLGHVSCKDIE